MIRALFTYTLALVQSAEHLIAAVGVDAKSSSFANLGAGWSSHRTTMSCKKLPPVLFVSHGGGPSFFLSVEEIPAFEGMDKDSAARRYMEGMVKQEKIAPPRAILVISAHWEEREFTVQTTAKPSLYYDYYNFPESTYQLQWAAQGDPAMAAKVKEVLQSKGLKCGENSERGYDHGVFIPLMLIYPDPPAPVLQLALKSNLNVDEHFALGEALAALREEGVLIMASGFTTHSRIDMEGEQPAPWVLNFQDAIHKAVTDPNLAPADRKKAFAALFKHPSFSRAHPRSEHFVPLLVAAGAAGYRPGRVLFKAAMEIGGLLEHYMFEH